MLNCLPFSFGMNKALLLMEKQRLLGQLKRNDGEGF
tara:strand:+ start:679 stop:786 length:108 start_codon:yes stop_codon:yes gene_type:complete